MALALRSAPLPAPPPVLAVEGGGVDRAATLARLRALVGAARPTDERLPAGIAGVDAWLGGWPAPGVVEISGAPGTGRLGLVLPALARLTRQGRPVVVVDPLQWFHPPGLRGADAARLVLVRPPLDQAAWAAEQVARSGAVAAVLALDLPPLGRQGWRLERAAEAGGATLFRVGEAPDPELPAALRVVTEGWEGTTLRVRCVRSRSGRGEGVRRVEVAA